MQNFAAVLACSPIQSRQGMREGTYVRTGGAKGQEGCIGGGAPPPQGVVQLQWGGRHAARQRSRQAQLIALAGVQRGLAGAHVVDVDLARVAQLEGCRGVCAPLAVAKCSRDSLPRLQADTKKH